MQHAFSAVYREPPKNWSAYEDGSRSERQRFEYVGATAYASIHIDLAAPGNSFDDFGKRFDAGDGGIELATTMI